MIAFLFRVEDFPSPPSNPERPTNGVIVCDGVSNSPTSAIKDVRFVGFVGAVCKCYAADEEGGKEENEIKNVEEGIEGVASLRDD